MATLISPFRKKCEAAWSAAVATFQHWQVSSGQKEGQRLKDVDYFHRFPVKDLDDKRTSFVDLHDSQKMISLTPSCSTHQGVVPGSMFCLAEEKTKWVAFINFQREKSKRSGQKPSARALEKLRGFLISLEHGLFEQLSGNVANR